MPMLQLRAKGIDAARARMKRWNPGEFVQLVAPEAAKSLLTWLRYYIAFRTGGTAKSLGTELAGTHLLATGNLVAWFLYSGTKPHPIVARNGKALAFPGGDGLVFRRAVMHPGTGGTNYPTAAWAAASPEIQVIAQRTAGRIFGGGV